jgi:AcrR family transcriptional regulator
VLRDGGLNFRQIAALTGIPKTTVYYYVTGKKRRQENPR